MAATPFTLDATYRRPRRGRVVIGGSPLRLFTLSDAGVRVMAAIEDRAELPAGHERLSDRLLDAGVLHPQPHAPTVPDGSPSLTVVIPARDEVPLFRPRTCRTIVIDDASRRPLHVPDESAPVSTRIEVVRLPVNAGPGGARNAGLALVDTEFVAFVDTDVALDQSDLTQLLGHFDDPRVALVAPRIRPLDAEGPLAAFERRHSPLDQGDQPARIAPATRVSFVPAAVIVCRTAAVRAVGGFDATLRFGEDVDLVWRLGEAGHRCRYEPSVVVHHRVRDTLREWLSQRFNYGSSAAPLAQRHAGALAPLRMSGWSATTWGAIVAGFPVIGATIGAGTAVALTRKLRSIPKSESLRVAAMGHVYAGRLVATTMTRAWWPVTVAAAVVSKRARRALLLAVLVPAALDWRAQRPALGAGRYVALRVLDDVAYGTGVWKGAITHRSAEALTPSFEPWPPKGSTR